jgi:mannosyl-3-phosphoglycerate phosphatase
LTSLVVVTDLDGTLLDEETYSYEDARPALEELRAQEIPLVLCSSKTIAEIEPLRRELRLEEPFIVENGGALVVPKDARGLAGRVKGRDGGPLVVPFGTPRADLVAALADIARETGVLLRGFAAMSARELSDRTGLDEEGAARAKARDFDEPFVLPDGAPESALARVQAAASRRGLHVTRGGHFFHLLGPHDKGRAVSQLLHLYGRAVRSIGLGDAANDLPLLRVVDEPILMPRARGGVDEGLASALPRAEVAPFPGPRGWNVAVQAAVRRSPRLLADFG